MFNFFKNGNLGYGIALGVGATFLLPVASRVVAGAAKPLLKETIRGGLYLYDTGKVVVAEARESIEDLSAEVKTEMKQSAEKQKTASKAGSSGSQK
ncbi:MAG: DUF5132 domain-containing protein [Thermodesulfobacteriota bacterium]